MPGRGPAPQPHRQRVRDEKRRARGNFRPVAGEGWQHGAIPDPPTGLSATSVSAWGTWFTAWFAAYWIPGDVPCLRLIVRLFDAVARGELQRAAELRLWLDTYGITPKGQQDRRWSAAVKDDQPPPRRHRSDDAYAHLKIMRVSDEAGAWAPH